MSHKDAPPETPTQTACREFWTRVQPHVVRAWGRGANGAFLAEESRLLHEAWEAASGDADVWKGIGLQWLDKTDWVQQTAETQELGQHRADVLRKRVERLQVEVAELRRALWLTVQSAGGQLWIERREAEAFDPDRSELTTEWCTDDRYLVRASTTQEAPNSTPPSQQQGGAD